MKINLNRIIVFIVIIIQLSILASIITSSVIILKNNKIVKLKCRLYDPFNFMKGRYIHLSFDIDSINTNEMKSIRNMTYDTLKLYEKMPLYCILVEKDGYSVVEDASFQKPAGDKIFIKLKINYISNDIIKLKIYFDQYYLQENYAIQAENLLRNSNVDEMQVSLLLAVGKDGNIVQKGFEIEGIPIEEYIKNNMIK